MKLETELCGIKLKNPSMLASGIMGLTGESMLRAAESGAGGVILKDIGEKPRKGHPNPTIFQKPAYILNAMGMSNPGVDNMKEEVEGIAGKAIVFANIFAENEEGFVYVAKKIESYGVRALELNVSCPNLAPGEKIGAIIGKNPQLVEKITRKVKENVKIPVFVKLTPNVDDITLIAKAAERGGADGITAINTVGPGMAINIDVGKPFLANKFGGMSGPAIKPIAIASVYKIHECVKIPIIGVGGITDGKDAIEMMMAGASAFQIGSGVFFHGIDVFKKTVEEMEKWLESKGYKDVKEIVGKAHVE